MVRDDNPRQASADPMRDEIDSDERPLQERSHRRRTLKMFCVSALSVCAVGSVAYAGSHQWGPTDAPQVSAAAQSYSPAEMQATLLREARDAFVTTKVDLGSAVVVAGTRNEAKLPPSDWSKASTMYAKFMQGDARSLKVFVGTGDDTPKDPAKICNAEDVTQISCSVETTNGGVVLATVTSSAKEAAPIYGEGAYAAASWGDVTEATLPQMRLSRRTFAVWPGGHITSVTEDVFSPTSLKPDANFALALDQMRRLATDSELATPIN